MVDIIAAGDSQMLLGIRLQSLTSLMVAAGETSMEMAGAPVSVLGTQFIVAAGETGLELSAGLAAEWRGPNPPDIVIASPHARPTIR